MTTETFYYFETLQLDPEASRDEIQIAYMRLMKQNETMSGDSDDQIRSKEIMISVIREAYEALTANESSPEEDIFVEKTASITTSSSSIEGEVSRTSKGEGNDLGGTSSRPPFASKDAYPEEDIPVKVSSSSSSNSSSSSASKGSDLEEDIPVIFEEDIPVIFEEDIPVKVSSSSSDSDVSYEDKHDFSKHHQKDHDTTSHTHSSHSEEHLAEQDLHQGYHGVLAKPFDGDDSSTFFFYSCDGAPGENGIDGKNGRDASAKWFGGRNGECGQDASDPTPGGSGRDVSFVISSYLSQEGFYQLDLQTLVNNDRANAQSGQSSVPLRLYEGLDFTSRGGGGGHGAKGGNGGNGQAGQGGSSYIDKYGNYIRSAGTPGGDGGDAGRGSSGADGGSGGNLDVTLDLKDIYLLMKIAACDPKTGALNRIIGGFGGSPGQHGKPGKGASGEPSGRDGRVCRDTLCPGRDGRSGSFTIRVQMDDSLDHLFSRRYDLKYQGSVANHLSDFPQSNVYEFGETVFINACTVANVGFMPSPSQRSLVRFESATLIEPEYSDYLFLAGDCCIKVGEEKQANQGYLHFCCPFSSSDGSCDHDPIREEADVKLKATQLGPENDTRDLDLLSDFQVDHPYFHEEPEQLTLRYPVENPSGILGVHTLGPQESSCLSLTLSNGSNLDLGSVSDTERRLLIKVSYADDKRYEIPNEYLEVFDADGHPVSIDKFVGDGFWQEVESLAALSDVELNFSASLSDKGIRTCETAGLQIDIYLQDIDKLSPDGASSKVDHLRRIQRRQFIVSYQPKFVESEYSDFIVFTTTSTTAEQVSAWEMLLSDTLGLVPRMLSFSRYGHMDASQIIETMPLRNILKDNVGIVLNEPFVAMPNTDSDRKTLFLPSSFLQSVYNFCGSTRFLIVGGTTESIAQLAPDLVGFNTVEASKEDVHSSTNENLKSFRREIVQSLKQERVQGFATERARPKYRSIPVKTRTLFRTPKRTNLTSIMVKRAEKLEKWLTKHDKLRHYRVEWHPSDSSVRIAKDAMKKGLRGRCWLVGEFKIYIGAPRYQNSLMLLEEVDNEKRSCSLAAKESILSLATIHAVIAALPLSKRIDCYCRSIRHLAATSSHSDDGETHRNVCVAVRDSLVSDFLWDTSNYYQGHLSVKDREHRSPTLAALLSNKSLSTLISECSEKAALCRMAKAEMSSLVAGLRSVADSKDLAPWWSPFSRKHWARWSMKQALKTSETHLEPVLDKAIIREERKTIDKDTKYFIKKVRGKFWTRARGRWREALAVTHSPENSRQTSGGSSSLVSSTRLRRDSELLNGPSHKVKKFTAKMVGPDEADHDSSDLRERLEVQQHVRKAVLEEREYFVSAKK